MVGAGPSPCKIHCVALSTLFSSATAHDSIYCSAVSMAAGCGRLSAAVFLKNRVGSCILGVRKQWGKGGPYRVQQLMSSHVEHRSYDFADHSMSCLSSPALVNCSGTLDFF